MELKIKAKGNYSGGVPAGNLEGVELRTKAKGNYSRGVPAGRLEGVELRTLYLCGEGS